MSSVRVAMVAALLVGFVCLHQRGLGDDRHRPISADDARLGLAGTRADSPATVPPPTAPMSNPEPISDAITGECVEFDWIEDGVRAANASTNDMGGDLMSWSFPAEGNYSTTGTVFTLLESRKLKDIRIIVAGVPWGTQPPQLSQFTYEIHLWPGSQNFFSTNGANGTSSINRALGLPTNSNYTTPFGLTTFQGFPGNYNTYDLRWDLAVRLPSNPIVLTPGEWVVSVILHPATPTSDGVQMFSDMGSSTPRGVYGDDVNAAGWNYQSGLPANYGMKLVTVSACPSGTCDPGEDSCNCPQDCGAPPASEVPGSTCSDGLNNDCDSAVDCADPDCASDAVACPNGQVPTISEWGMAAMALLTLIAGTLLLHRRHHLSHFVFIVPHCVTTDRRLTRKPLDLRFDRRSANYPTSA